MTMPGLSTSVLNAIYHRRSIRSYTPVVVDEARLHALLEAAVQAPTARHQEPWSFLIVQDKTLMRRISDVGKELLRAQLAVNPNATALPLLEPDFNLFYNASTLLLICGPGNSGYVVADCWLAAENLMLAAHAMNLGSCVIGSALPALNGVMREELGIPADLTVHVALVLGQPAEEPPASPRKAPVILRHIRPGAGKSKG